MPDDSTTLPSSDATGRATRSSGRSAAVYLSLGLAVLVLVALIVFIAQNSHDVEIRYLGATTSLGFGVALLLAAVAGALVAALVGVVLKIRRSMRSHS